MLCWQNGGALFLHGSANISQCTLSGNKASRVCYGRRWMNACANGLWAVGHETWLCKSRVDGCTDPWVHWPKASKVLKMRPRQGSWADAPLGGLGLGGSSIPVCPHPRDQFCATQNCPVRPSRASQTTLFPKGWQRRKGLGLPTYRDPFSEKAAAAFGG